MTPAPYAAQYARAVAPPLRYTHAGEADFHAAMHADPQNPLHPLVYADWLEERGRPAAAEVIRRHVDQLTPGDHASPTTPPREFPHESDWTGGMEKSVYLPAPDGPHAGTHVAWVERRSEHRPSERFYFLAYTSEEDARRLAAGLRAEGVG